MSRARASSSGKPRSGSRAVHNGSRRRAGDSALRDKMLLAAMNRVLIETLPCETDEEVARICLRVAEQMTGSEIGFIGELNAAGRLHTIALGEASWEACGIPREKAIRLIDDVEIRGTETRPLRENRSVLLNRPEEDPAWHGLPDGHAPIRNYLGVPLKRGGRAFGVISLANKPSPYTAADLENLEAMSAAFVQVLEKKRADINLKESERKYRSLVDNALVGVYKSSVEGKILFANKALSTILGYGSPEEMIAGDARGLYRNGRDRDSILAALARAGGLASYELELLTKAGEPKTVIVSETLDKGVISGMMSDITPLKASQKEHQRTLEVLRQTLSAAIQAIGLIVEKRDPYTSGHQKRVADLSRAIATEMGLSRQLIDGIRIAASLHDLGKISIPAEILSKPARLSDKEFALVKTHSQVAFDILTNIQAPWDLAEIVLQHHERLDGSGYPRGLRADQIRIEARIIGVADVVEAMIFHRPYRPALPLEEALAELEAKSGVLYDPPVVSACLRLFREKRFAFR